jgi:hypothetical protein
MTRAHQIISAALSATTYDSAIAVAKLIEADIGIAYQRPVGDRINNYGIMTSSGGSYEYKAIEPITNMQDSILERLAAGKFGELSKVPFATPEQAAHDLLGAFNYRQQADRATVTFEESDPPTRSSKRMTILYRDTGCGIEPAQISKTIFALGSSHKSRTPWQQGAFGLGGASTYRNAHAVVLVTRRAPEMNPDEDRIAVAVVLWEATGKGQMAYYLTTTDWHDGDNRDAGPWSAAADEYPGFEPGTHLALVSYGVEGFHLSRSGDERTFDMLLNTRLFEPVVPIRFTNNTLRGRNEYLRGLRHRLDDNPSKDRLTDVEDMLYAFGGRTYKLPVHYWVFPTGDAGHRRRFVARRHSLMFTSNGQVHHHWNAQDFRWRVKSLNKLDERILVVVETDALPIELRTTLFTPDRSEMIANEAALQLEDQVADFLSGWDKLVEINNQLVREAISRSSGSSSTLSAARRIAAAMKVRGFGLGGTGATGGGGGSKRGPRRKIETYPDPTTIEGPDLQIIEDGKVRYLPYMLNAHDDFLDSGRGELTFTCDHPDIDVAQHVALGRLRDGYLRVQLQVPEGADEGDFELAATLEGWHRAAGGTGSKLSYATKLRIVDESSAVMPGPGQDGGKQGAEEGSMVALLWAKPDTWPGLHNGIPGIVDDVAAADLAAAAEEYKPLASRGQEKIATIVLNEEYAPLRRYIASRAQAVKAETVDRASERYAVGTGVGLLILREHQQERSKAGHTVDEDDDLHARQAIARSVLTMMPDFDSLIREAGIEDSPV